MIEAKNKSKIVFKNARIIDPHSDFDDKAGLIVENKVLKDFGKHLLKNDNIDDALIIDCNRSLIC